MEKEINPSVWETIDAMVGIFGVTWGIIVLVLAFFFGFFIVQFLKKSKGLGVVVAIVLVVVFVLAGYHYAENKVQQKKEKEYYEKIERIKFE